MKYSSIVSIVIHKNRCTEQLVTGLSFLFLDNRPRPDIKLITPSTTKQYKMMNSAYKIQQHTHVNYQSGYNRMRE
jgi:hypothetical protein